MSPGEQAHHLLTERRRHEKTLFNADVFALHDGIHNGGEGGRATDAPVLQFAHQTGFGEARRRLGLFAQELAAGGGDALPLSQHGYGIFGGIRVCLFILHGRVGGGQHLPAGFAQHAPSGLEDGLGTVQLSAKAQSAHVIHGIGQLRGQRS